MNPDLAAQPTLSTRTSRHHQIYLHADLAAKEAVLQRLTNPTRAPARFHSGDQLLAFLQAL